MSPLAYTHFLRLSLGYRIISSDLFKEGLDIAQQLFKDFVSQFSDLFPDRGLGYNVHNLLHIVDDVKEYGTIDSFSAYQFENFIQLIGHQIRKPQHVIQQIFNRLQEIQYSKIKITPREYNPLELKAGDNCVLDDCKTYIQIVVSPAKSEYNIQVKDHVHTKDFFTAPIPSSDLLIVQSTGNGSNPVLDNQRSIPLSSIIRKCYTLPYKNDFVLLALI